MAEPAYAFSLPSLEDDIVLECRLYHPDRSRNTPPDAFQGAIFAHPYAPLGGNFDDGVVLSAAHVLLHRGFFVATFNFRGAGESGGRTSWSGRDEQHDFCSLVGFLVCYLHALSGGQQATIRLVLGGYSYGSLVLARLPELAVIIKRFQDCVLGSTAAEVLLRARTLALQTRRTWDEEEELNREGLRGRQQVSGGTARAPRPSSIKVGGQETNQSERKRSQDSRRSGDFVRRSIEMPHRIKAHLHKRHGSNDSLTQSNTEKNRSDPPVVDKFDPTLSVQYLIVSPVLVPFTATLLPPGTPLVAFPHRSHDSLAPTSESQFLRAPTLVIFGSSDSFTSSRRLQTWSERQAAESTASDFEWTKIDDAGHFWHEDGVMRKLRARIKVWLDSTLPPP